ncbi:MAG TPA: glycosyltransferase [Candidatus Sulfopaludibacter sp.]|jgi:GT2 family glycosyltransferase|nr:glycosyltransferase [Candidatus Sulfopaludibacter sp.]
MNAAFRYHVARIAGRLRPHRQPPLPVEADKRQLTPGVSLVIPSRNGKELLRAQLPGIQADLAEIAAETIVVDNGSDDGTAAWLHKEWPQAQVDVSPEPLSFARAVNRGIARAAYSHVCLLNNDMRIEPGFFGSLGAAFDRIPDLFCATAQIRFPAGVRREETGKAVMAQETETDFPLRCDEPFPGEDLTWVLYGSGGCSVYDAAKLRALGSLDEIYEPAYVEDLDLGYRAWQRGWPSVYVDGAVVEHRHRATTSRYYDAAELDRILEINYLRFLARAVADARLFRRLWDQAMLRLKLLAETSGAARQALEAAASIAVQGGPATTNCWPEESFLALTNGSVAVFPGGQQSSKPRLVVATPALRGRTPGSNHHRDQIVVAFTDNLSRPSADVLANCTEVVLVRRAKGRDGNSLAFRAALSQTIHKWQPVEVRLETSGMTKYMSDCGSAKIILSN